MSRLLVAAALSLLALAGEGRAQEPPRNKEPVRLDTKTLGVMVADLGYESKLLQDTFHFFRAGVKEQTSPVWVSVTADKKHIRLFTEFTLRAGFDKAPAETWRKIMEKNFDLAPSSFGLDEKGSRLTLHHMIPNADITPVALRKEITAFVDIVWKNQDLWFSANFLPAMSSEAQKVLDKIQGKWKAETVTALGKPGAADVVRTFIFSFEKNQMVAFQGDKELFKAGVQLTVKDGTTTIDLVPASGASELGILKLEGDTLTICTGSIGNPRATKFESTEQGKETLLVLKRAKP